jgi:hypothetical protein
MTGSSRLRLGAGKDCDISQLDVVGKLIKGNVATEVIHDEEDLVP